MNTTSHRARLLGVTFLWLALGGEQACIRNHAVGRPQDAALSWRSVRMQAIEREYNQLWQLNSAKQQANPGKGKDIYGETLDACQRLFSERLSYQDLRALAATCDTLPIRFQDRYGWFSGVVLEYMFQTFVAMGDRDALVDLLSKRFVTHIGSGHRIEYYLVTRTSLPQDFRGCRLRDPMLVLGEAYLRCRTSEVREEIAAAVRRGFGGLEIDGKDDTEFVANAMQWYEKEKGDLIVNHRYWQNDNLPLDATHQDFNLPSWEVSGGRQPLFEKTTSAWPGSGRTMAVLVLWLIHLVIAAVLCAPIVFLGRQRVHWRPWESIAFILPFCVWVLLMVSPLSMERKGLGNLVEPFYLALGAPIAAMVRIGTGRLLFRPAQVNLVIAAIVGVLCIAAAATFFIAPPWFVIG